MCTSDRPYAVGYPDFLRPKQMKRYSAKVLKRRAATWWRKGYAVETMSAWHFAQWRQGLYAWPYGRGK